MKPMENFKESFMQDAAKAFQKNRARLSEEHRKWMPFRKFWQRRLARKYQIFMRRMKE